MSGQSGLEDVPCYSLGRAGLSPARDCLVVEEPIELRICGNPVATVMRTPGADRELAVGFFFNESWIAGAADIGSLALCGSAGAPDAGNVVDLIAPAGRSLRVPAAPRGTASVSSCGVCGKRTIAEVLAAVSLPPPRRGREAPPLDPAMLLGLPALLRPAQRLFDRTGALHAAGLFDSSGQLILLREDVGRHNAVDKVIGALVLEDRVPFEEGILLASGRVSFEIIQKALRAGIGTVAAISGVSTLARNLALEGGITLIGFLREASFKVYAHPERLGAPGALEFPWPVKPG